MMRQCIAQIERVKATAAIAPTELVSLAVISSQLVIVLSPPSIRLFPRLAEILSLPPRAKIWSSLLVFCQ